MRKTSISPAIFQELLESASNAGAKGQAQYFTPTEWAEVLSIPLPKNRPAIVDLQCGNGQLLQAARRHSHLLGCDIDAPPSTLDPQNFVHADITKFYPLLKAVRFEADLFVLNPPWDMHWHRDRLLKLYESTCPSAAVAFDAEDGRTSSETIDSTVATTCIALDLCSDYGEFVLIANEATLQRLILGENAPHSALSAHVWAHVVIDGNICIPSTPNPRPSDFKTGVIYVARSHTFGRLRESAERHVATLKEAEHACRELAADRLYLRKGPTLRDIAFTEDTVDKWKAAAEEWTRLNPSTPDARPSYNLWLENGVIRTALSLFDAASERFKDQAQKLFELNGKKPMQLVVQVAHRKALESACFGGPFRVDPDLQRAVKDALTEYNLCRAPLYPLSDIKRLGYLDEHDLIECKQDAAGFTAGQSYALRSLTVQVNRRGTKLNIHGDLDDVEWNGSELGFFIRDDDGVERLFMEERLRHKSIKVSILKPGVKELAKAITGDEDATACAIDFTLQELVEHFTIPEVLDVAALNPDGYNGYLRLLEEIETLCSSLKFRPFQKDGYARLALTDGAIGGIDRGLGKSLAAYTIPALKVGFRRDVRSLHPLAPVLLIVPAGLHSSISDEGELHFKNRPVALESQSDFYRLSTIDPRSGKRELPPGYYITSYTALASNGVSPFPKLTSNTLDNMAALHLTERQAEEWFETRDVHYSQHYVRLEAHIGCSLSELRAKWFRLRKMYSDEGVRAELDEAWNTLSNITPAKGTGYAALSPEQKFFVRHELVRATHGACAANVSEARWYPWGKVKCVYSPSLADECQDAFEAIMLDESTKMKGEETYVGVGARQMTARYRYPLTGTPIKNRLPDIFRMAWWAAGGKEEPHGRFPFGDEAEARADFSKEFLISERNLTREDETNRRYVRFTPQVCNIHRCWKILSALVLRQRKEDCGEQLVPKIRHIVRVPMGKHQAEVYQYHLKAKYIDVNKKPAIGARLSSLRIAAANPASAMLKRPHGDNTVGTPSTHYDYTPKVSAQLKLILATLQRREQIVLFSSFLDALDVVGARLAEAGVAHLILDGRVSPSKRGRLAKQFKLGPGRSPYPVMLASEECMSEGYSFDLANNIARSSYSWAYDKGEQAVDRVHRLTSRKPVNVWGVLCNGSIDRKLEGLNLEKGDACDLVLDGKLFGENPTEVNLAELLHVAQQEFKPGMETIDERELEKEWPELRAQLAAAARVWSEPENVVAFPPPSSSSLDPETVDVEYADLPLWQMH